MTKPKHPFFKFLKVTFKTYPKVYFVSIFFALVNASIALFNSFSLSIIIRFAEVKNWQYLWYVVVLVVLVNIILLALYRLADNLTIIHYEKANQKLFQIASLHMSKVKFEYLENNEYIQLKENVKFALENQGVLHSMISSTTNLFQNIITLIGFIAILAFFDPWVIIVILGATAIQILITIITLKLQLKFFNDLVPINQRFSYFLEQLMMPSKAKDIVIFKVGSMLEKKYYKFSNDLMDYFNKFTKKVNATTMFSVIVKNIESCLIYILLTIKTLATKTSLSLFSLNVSSAISLSTTLTSLVNNSIQFIRYYAYVVPFIQLLEIPVEENNGSIIMDQEIETIEFKDVTFSYPKTDKIVLDKISFKINKGEKISIVGLNGAGKTTIVKLICRLYQPTSGQILINGQDISQYEYHAYIEKISCVFQDYKIFSLTLKENISLDDDNTQKINQVVEKVGLTKVIEKLPYKLDSIYGKEFDNQGVALSGGETQKLAIAKALYKDSSLVILDEPTSALDPLAEAEIYEKFSKLVNNKTAFYISHRMSSSIFCDKILVLDGGKIVDFAPHQELMKKTDSLYYKLFHLQSKNYQIENNDLI